MSNFIQKPLLTIGLIAAIILTVALLYFNFT